MAVSPFATVNGYLARAFSHANRLEGEIGDYKSIEPRISIKA